jgi:hypothetical protein
MAAIGRWINRMNGGMIGHLSLLFSAGEANRQYPQNSC